MIIVIVYLMCFFFTRRRAYRCSWVLSGSEVCVIDSMYMFSLCAGARFFFQAEDGIRVLVRSRGCVYVYKSQCVYVLFGSVCRR